jgi:uncharacterized protein (TIGR02611 family)
VPRGRTASSSRDPGRFRAVFRWIRRHGRRILITIAGFAVLLAGLVMLVTPGPGLLAVVVGLSILASEYAWAQRALDQAKERASRAAKRAKNLRRRKR